MTAPKPSTSFGRWRKNLYRAANGRMTTPASRQAEISTEDRARQAEPADVSELIPQESSGEAGSLPRNDKDDQSEHRR